MLLVLNDNKLFDLLRSKDDSQFITRYNSDYSKGFRIDHIFAKNVNNYSNVYVSAPAISDHIMVCTSIKDINVDNNNCINILNSYN